MGSWLLSSPVVPSARLNALLPQSLTCKHLPPPLPFKTQLHICALGGAFLAFPGGICCTLPRAFTWFMFP